MIKLRMFSYIKPGLHIVVKPGFHLQQTPRPRHKKQSNYVLEQSSGFMETRLKDRRTCLRRCFKEDIKVLSTLIANISCERRIPMIISTM